MQLTWDFLSFNVVFLNKHLKFRRHFVPGPRPIRVEGCAVIRKVLEGAVSPGPWTRRLQAQVGL